jgi:putative drug exporter of the RND superfamily
MTLQSAGPRRTAQSTDDGGALRRFAVVITARPRLVILVWALLIAVCAPFALHLNSSLTRQGASKVVPGTGSARAEQVVEHSFPAHSQYELTVTIEASNVYAPQVRRLMSDLDQRIESARRAGQVLQSTSAFTVLRDAAVRFLRQAAAPLAGLSGPDLDDAVNAAVATGRIPPSLRAPVAVVAADPTAVTATATKLAATTDWRSFPVAVPAEQSGRLLSADGHVALISVSFARQRGHDPDFSWLRTAAATGATRAGGGITTHVTGEIALLHDTYATAEADNSTMEIAAYVIILIVLLLFFRAVIPAVITLVSIGLAMYVSEAALYAISRQVTLTQFTVTIMTFVMLGAGIDYSMLLSSRYRQERLAGLPHRQAVVNATARAGESILLAGAAVVLAFGTTLLSPVDWIPPLGYGGLVGIPIILGAALTITPCLLMLLGDRFFALGYRPLADLERDSFLGRHLGRTAEFARRRRVAIVLAFAAVTVPLAVVTATHSSTADPVALSPATDSKAGFTLVATRWNDGAALPTIIAGKAAPGLVSGGKLTARGRRAVTDLTARLAALPGVAEVDAVTRPFGSVWTNAQFDAMPDTLRGDFLSADGALRIVAVPQDHPYSPAAKATVRRLVGVVAADRTVGALDVGGATSVDTQYGDALTRSLWQMVALVSIGMFVLLMFALRSVLVPARLIATIMLSNVWAIGLTVLIFRDLLGDQIIDDLPIFLVILMMGLGMDYEIFLVTRVRELLRVGVDQEGATVRAVVDTGRVINAAGLVMAGCLGTMVLSSTVMLREYGTGLGLAVLLDSTLIRMLLVPATLLLPHRYNWWMPRLRRRRAA